MTMTSEPSPFDLKPLLETYSDEDRAWMIVDPVHLKTIKFRDERHPKSEIVRLFRSREDAEQAMKDALSEPGRWIMAGAVFVTVEVPLLKACRVILQRGARDKSRGVIVYEAGSTLPRR